MFTPHPHPITYHFSVIPAKAGIQNSIDRKLAFGKFSMFYLFKKIRPSAGRLARAFSPEGLNGGSYWRTRSEYSFRDFSAILKKSSEGIRKGL